MPAISWRLTRGTAPPARPAPRSLRAVAMVSKRRWVSVGRLHAQLAKGPPQFARAMNGITSTVTVAAAWVCATGVAQSIERLTLRGAEGAAGAAAGCASVSATAPAPIMPSSIVCWAGKPPPPPPHGGAGGWGRRGFYERREGGCGRHCVEVSWGSTAPGVRWGPVKAPRIHRAAAVALLLLDAPRRRGQPAGTAEFQ